MLVELGYGERVDELVNVDVIVNDDDFSGIDIHHEEDLILANQAIKIRRNDK